MKDTWIKQIIIATDGKSNIGGDPVYESKLAKEKGIVVNAIGIIKANESNEKSLLEIENIANAGGGMWERSTIEKLGRTMCVMTQKTMNMTIHNVVNEELQEILGTNMNGISPKDRSKIVDYVDKLSENISLKCCILMDCSSSMVHRMDKGKESILDLIDSLIGRVGKSEVALIGFPHGDEYYKVICDFTSDLDLVKKKVNELKCGGTTPTAMAIKGAVRLMEDKKEEIVEEGFLRDNIV
ncbi:MAG: VWA domain-containing protein [Anaeromicrobium sp.]|jgi:Ca-activated chloride channel family protein|uniref:vWA domain-containing protein n=1 Tax=Anaeromicrobium sp. TaxID=1929132 RepID=UPI0025F7AF73|nr:VWA domain-containing protein [Anaeromicrobium sp.]MCT4594057.1 VWA domain-containing protein [Anaeromicrobium sp.]